MPDPDTDLRPVTTGGLADALTRWIEWLQCVSDLVDDAENQEYVVACNLPVKTPVPEPPYNPVCAQLAEVIRASVAQAQTEVTMADLHVTLEWIIAWAEELLSYVRAIGPDMPITPPPMAPRTMPSMDGTPYVPWKLEKK